MRTRVALSLMVCILLAGLLAGCGGGEEQSGNGGGSQNGGGARDGGGSQERGGGRQGAAARNKAPQAKIALGTIASVGSDKVVLRPSTRVQSEGPLTFEIKQNTKITVNGRDAELADVKKGQDAQINYVSRNKRNRALEVAIVGGG